MDASASTSFAHSPSPAQGLVYSRSGTEKERFGRSREDRLRLACIRRCGLGRPTPSRREEDARDGRGGRRRQGTSPDRTLKPAAVPPEERSEEEGSPESEVSRCSGLLWLDLWGLIDPSTEFESYS